MHFDGEGKPSYRNAVSIRASKEFAKGTFVRAPGSDIRLNELIASKGQVIRETEIGLCATLGIGKVKVFKRPKVGVLSTGDELEDPFKELVEFGKIRDSNKAMIMALLSQTNCEVVDCGKLSDDKQSVGYLKTLSEGYNLIVTTGGVSMGDADFVKPFLDANGTVFFGRLNMKPGKPTTFAKLDKSLVFALPGNPTSAFVTAKLFLPLAISTLQGAWP